MAHDHHHHESANAYYVEQLFNIALCGALGGIMVLMYFNGMVNYLFGNNVVQYERVLLGGLGLLAVVLVRAVYVWFAAGSKTAPDHIHEHTHDHAHCDHGDCGHEHHHHHHHEHEEGIKAAPSPALTNLPLAPAALPALAGHTHDHDHHHDHDHGHSHGHDHDHDHDHGWSPWRFLLLVLPVVLFFLGLPSRPVALGGSVVLDEGAESQLKSLAGGPGKGDGVIEVTFKQLEQTAMSRDARDVLTGQTVRVTGMYVGDDTSRFTLRRVKVNCCAADAVPVNAVIAINPAAQKKNFQLEPAHYQNKWVTVTGRLYFLYNRAKNEYLTTVLLFPDESTPLSQLVEIVPQPADPYVN
jgi:hypothetical protein